MFLNEIKQMMYIFGDVKSPSAESALLIEDIVLKQMRDTIKRAGEVCEKQGRTNVTITDILFLYRKNLVKLKRIVKHIELKEMSRIMSVDDDSVDDVVAVSGGRKKSQFSLDFLSDFDQEEIFSDGMDNVQRRRLESLDALTKNMNSDEYAEFTEARQSSSFYKNMARFKEWLDLSNLFPMVTVNSNMFTVLGYLAYDAVQEMVELAMLIKHHQQGDLIHSFHPPPQRASVTMDTTTSSSSSTPLFFNISSPDITAATTVSTSSPPSSPLKSPSGGSLSSPTHIITKPKPRKRGRPPKNSTSSTVSDKVVSTVTTPPSSPVTALQPHHIMEAIRRQTNDLKQPMVPFKSYFS